MTLLVYGADGIVGEHVARAAVERGWDPILAGHDGDTLRDIGRDLRCSVREFPLQPPETVAASVRDIDAVLNCAEPFTATAEPLVTACLDAGTDYLDVTGAVPVLAALVNRDEAASTAGVSLLPGVGFDVVPTDCLAARLLERRPDATTLALGIDADGGSRGTDAAAVRGFGEGVVVREDGRLVRRSVAGERHTIDFGRGPCPAVTVPGGDVVTAAHTTGVEHVTVYTAVSREVRRALRLSGPIGPLLRTRLVRFLFDRLVAARVDEPTAAERAENRAVVWGEVQTESGETVVERLETPDPHDLTAETALAAAERVLDDDAPAGFNTPAAAFGSTFVDGVDGVVWNRRDGADAYSS